MPIHQRLLGLKTRRELAFLGPLVVILTSSIPMYSVIAEPEARPPVLPQTAKQEVGSEARTQNFTLAYATDERAMLLYAGYYHLIKPGDVLPDGRRVVAISRRGWILSDGRREEEAEADGS